MENYRYYQSVFKRDPVMRHPLATVYAWAFYTLIAIGLTLCTLGGMRHAGGELVVGAICSLIPALLIALFVSRFRRKDR